MAHGGERWRSPSIHGHRARRGAEGHDEVEECQSIAIVTPQETHPVQKQTRTFIDDGNGEYIPSPPARENRTRRR